jgi:chromosome segregation ATPase
MTETKEQLKRKLNELEEAVKTTRAGYDELLEQATLLQREHGRRLAYLRLFEKFVNDNDRMLTQLKMDITEVNASYVNQQEETEETEGTGEGL